MKPRWLGYQRLYNFFYSLSRMLYNATLLAMPTRFRLRELLEKLGISQSELARRSGVSFPTINAMCTNRTATVALATLDRIADALGVEPGDLIARDPKRRR